MKENEKKRKKKKSSNNERSTNERGNRERNGECLVCGNPLLKPGGFHKTRLCGPCYTGEAGTAGLMYDEY